MVHLLFLDRYAKPLHDVQQVSIDYLNVTCHLTGLKNFKSFDFLELIDM